MPDKDSSAPADPAAGAALDGYDPVTYFSEGGPLKGREQNRAQWQGEVWYFVSAGNLAEFLREPTAYTPAFGGACAFGTALGRRAEGSPLAWRIIDGRLCLMRDRSVKGLSRLFTSRISSALRTESAVRGR